jgi:two-component system, chemotaxis family, protein-glutamate methylesterase/glutaminase
MAERNTIKPFELLLIGGSAGSLEAILEFLPGLPRSAELAIVMVLHRKSGESLLTEVLSGKTSWQVKEAEEKERIEPGTIYVAASDYHLLIEQDKTFSLDYSEKVNYSRPSIDVTFDTAAEVYGASVIALLLSGANQDGTEGLQRIKEAGGYVMVQCPDEAVVRYMPQHALEQVAVDKVISIDKLPALLQQLLQR